MVTEFLLDSALMISSSQDTQVILTSLLEERLSSSTKRGESGLGRLTDEYRDLLWRQFPRAGYWLNLLPSPRIHSSMGQ